MMDVLGGVLPAAEHWINKSNIKSIRVPQKWRRNYHNKAKKLTAQRIDFSSSLVALDDSIRTRNPMRARELTTVR
jgi:hypothetical protein